MNPIDNIMDVADTYAEQYADFAYGRRPEQQALDARQALRAAIEQAMADASAELKATDRQVEILSDDLSRCSKENKTLRGALTELVKVCETHDQAIADVIGKPPGWKDAYLDQARAALAQGEKT